MQILKFLLPLFCFVSFTFSAQDKKIDSINNDALSEYRTLLLVAKQQRIIDSVAKANLEEKIQGLKMSDNLEKKTLEKQLNTLRLKDSIRLVEKKIAIESRRLAAVGYPVTGFFKDTLFTIYNKSGSFTAHERAEAVTNRIKKMGGRFGSGADSLKIVKNENTVDLFNGEDIIISLSENDGLWNDTTTPALAEDYKKIIQTAVEKYKSEIDLGTLAKEVGLTILILFIIGLAILYTGRFFTWVNAKIKEEQDDTIKGIKIRGHLIINAHQQVITLLILNYIIKWVVILLLIAIALPYLFGIFPWSRTFPDTLLGYVLSPLRKIAVALWNYLPNLITIIVIIFVFRYALLALKSLKYEIEIGRLKLRGFYQEWANPTYHILRILIFAFMIVVIFEYLPKSESPIFKGVSVFLGLLFTFGSAGSLSNMTAGLILTYMRLFKIGDRVKIGEATGDVIEKSLLVIRLRTSNNEIISIPNSTVMSSQTINYTSESLEKGLILSTIVNIGYEIPWKEVEKALLEAADRTQTVLKDPKPFVLHTRLEDFYVAYEVCIYTRNAGSQSTIYSQLHRNIQDTFNEAGIEIMSPHYRAERDGNSVAMPAQPTADVKSEPAENDEKTES